jgi:hypothetical protein
VVATSEPGTSAQWDRASDWMASKTQGISNAIARSKVIDGQKKPGSTPGF